MKQHYPLKNAQQEKRIFRNRIFFSVGVVVFFLLLLVARYAYLQISGYDEFSTASDKNRIRLQPLAPERGYIYDRNGVLLADNYPVFSATLSRADVEDIDDTIARLTPVLQLTEEDIERFKSRIKTSRKTERVSIKLNLNESDIARFSEVKFQFPGVNIETQMTRYYPHGELFALSSWSIGMHTLIHTLIGNIRVVTAQPGRAYNIPANIQPHIRYPVTSGPYYAFRFLT